MSRESFNFYEIFGGPSQDLWVDIGLMHRSEIPGSKPQLLPKSKYHSYPRDHQQELFDLLWRHRWYVVPSERVTNDLYGSSDKFDRHSTKSHVQKLRKRVGIPIYAVPIGWSIGVNRVDLTPFQARALNVFRKNPEVWVPRSEIALAIYGEVTDQSLSITRNVVYELRQKPSHGQLYEIEPDSTSRVGRRWREGRGYRFSKIDGDRNVTIAA